MDKLIFWLFQIPSCAFVESALYRCKWAMAIKSHKASNWISSELRTGTIISGFILIWTTTCLKESIVSGEWRDIITKYNFISQRATAIVAEIRNRKTIWAATGQNQQNKYAPSEDSDQSLIRVFAVRRKKPWILIYQLNAQRRLWSDWADAQANLSLRWAHTHFVGFVISWLIYTFRIKVVVFQSNYLSRNTPCIICWFYNPSMWYVRSAIMSLSLCILDGTMKTGVCYGLRHFHNNLLYIKKPLLSFKRLFCCEV